MASETIMIEVQNLCKEFKTSKKYPGLRGAVKSLFTTENVIKKAVQDVSFRIKEGEIVGYIGSNGAGKSTTIKMMTGILVPTSGTCFVNSIEPYKHRTENAKHIGVVFGQRTQLWWDLPLTETFTVLKEIYQVNDADFKSRMSFINEVLGIKEFENNTVRTLSLGQRMRADLGAALIHNPKVLFLDEPTIGLDVVVKDKIRKAILEMNREYKTTILLTTHDMQDIETLCHHIIIIDDGRKIYDGTQEELKSNYGAETKLILKVEDSTKISKTDILTHFRNKEEMKISTLGDKVEILFHKNQLSASEILSYIMQFTNVLDLTTADVDLTSIVKQIYVTKESLNKKEAERSTR